MNPANKNHIWKSLEKQAAANHSYPTPGLMKKKISSCQITLDYSNQHINDDALDLLVSLADSCHLKEKIIHLMSGVVLNISEQRPALHTALRAPDQEIIKVNGKNIMEEVIHTRHEMKHISEKIRNKLWLGHTGKAITDIVNIGIGGSDLGPKFCIQALKKSASKALRYHFVSDVDPYHFENTIETLNPETTLFIVSSKSFTTPETLYNAEKAKKWIGDKAHASQHFIAVTANEEKAHEFGIQTILPIWDWVGGRYSFCSAINLISAIAIGFEHFEQILKGAQDMDKHFKETPFNSNLPVMLALLGIWNNNFLSIHNHLILTYTLQFEKFVPYIQQLDMESNGKSIDNQGKTVPYATGPIIWGGLGNQAQHSYYQLLCQGTHKVTTDFITIQSFDKQIINDMAKAKINILTKGVNPTDHPYGFIPGNIPLNHIQLNECNPYSIGALIALYEHKIFTQSVIWDINPFDQPGVESAKSHSKISLNAAEMEKEPAQ